MEFWLTQLGKNETDSLEQKRRLIDAFLNSVFLYEDSAVITFNYKFGSKTVSLADIHNYSDLTGLGEPSSATGSIRLTSFFQTHSPNANLYLP